MSRSRYVVLFEAAWRFGRGCLCDILTQVDNLLLSESEKFIVIALGIEGVLLFGSQAQKIAQDSSDYDIGVLTGPEMVNRKKCYDRLYELFSEKIHQLVDIDIVFLRRAPLELQHHAAKYGVVLYQKKSNTISRFREDVMRQYADFAPVRRQFQQGTFARIAQV